MFSKFKITPSSNAYSTHFPLVEVYKAEIRRLRSENEFLKLQNNSLVVHLNKALAKLDEQHAPFKATQKGFWQLTRSGRNKKKRKIKSLVLESIKGIEEFVPKEVCFFLPYFCFKTIQLLWGTLRFAVLQYGTINFPCDISVILISKCGIAAEKTAFSPWFQPVYSTWHK